MGCCLKPFTYDCVKSIVSAENGQRWGTFFQDHDLDAVVDLLALLDVHRAPACFEQRVQLGDAPAIQFWPLVEWSARKKAVSGSA